MATTPTPGPWIIKPRADGLVNVYHAAGATDVALCVRPRDANLIVAAPEMFDVLEACLLRDDIADDELGDLIRGVLAKAA